MSATVKPEDRNDGYADMTAAKMQEARAWEVTWTDDGRPCGRVFNNEGDALDWAACLTTKFPGVVPGGVRGLFAAPSGLDPVTVEACAKVAEEAWRGGVSSNICRTLAAAIRALSGEKAT